MNFKKWLGVCEKWIIKHIHLVLIEGFYKYSFRKILSIKSHISLNAFNAFYYCHLLQRPDGKLKRKKAKVVKLKMIIVYYLNI